MTRKKLPSHALTLLLTFAACGALGCAADEHDTLDENADSPADQAHEDNATGGTVSETELNLIAKVSFDNGGALKFFEPEPGVLIEMETDSAGSPRERLPNEDKLSAADKYEALSGDEAPTRLVALSDELQTDDASGASEKIVDFGTPFATKGEQGPFRDLYCRDTDRYFERLDWNAPTRLKAGKANYYKFGVFAGAGQVAVDWLWKGAWHRTNLSAGWMIGLTITASGPGRDVETKVTPTPFDARFDHCVNYHY